MGSSMLLRRPGPGTPPSPITYTPTYTTDFDEYAAGLDIGDQTGWDHATSLAEIVTALNGDIRVRGSANNNTRSNRTATVTPRASMYAKATVIAVETSGRAGLSFHGATGVGTTNIFYISNVAGVYTMFWGTITGSTSTTAPVLTAAGSSGTSGFTLASKGIATTGPWDLEVRAATANSVMLFINDTLVGHHTTNQAGDVCGLYLTGVASEISTFEYGTYADTTSYGISLVGTPVLGTTTVVVPTGVADNSILWAAASKNGSTAPAAFTWPAGWTVVASGGNGSSSTFIRMEVAYRKWNTGDASSFSFTGVIPTRTACAAYGGVDLITPILLSTVMAVGTTATTTVTASLANTDTLAWRVASFGAASSIAITYSTMTVSASGGTMTERIEGTAGSPGPVGAGVWDSTTGVPITTSTVTGTHNTPTTGQCGVQALLRPKRNP